MIVKEKYCCPWVYIKLGVELLESSKDYCNFNDELCVRDSGQECAIYNEWLEEKDEDMR